METTRRALRRNTREGKIGGVAAGIADYFSIDPTIVRLAFVLLVLAGGFGLVAYLVAWIVMPAEGGASPGDNRVRWLVGLAAILIGLVAWAGTIGFWWIDDVYYDRSYSTTGRLGLALVLVVGGLAAIAYVVSLLSGMPRGGASDSRSRWLLGLAVILVGMVVLLGTYDFGRIGDTFELWPFVLVAIGVGLLVWRRNGGGGTAPSAAVAAEDDTTELPPAAPPAVEEREPVVPVGWITFGVIGLSAIVAAALDATGALDVPVKWFAVYAFGVAVVGTVAGAFVGRVAGPLALAMTFALAIPLGWAVDVPLRWSAGDRTIAPATAAELDDEYRLGAGQLVLDLTSLDLGGTTREVAASVSAGELVVLVPYGTTVDVDASVSAGDAFLFDEAESGVGVSLAKTEAALGSTDRLVLDLDVGIGTLDVRR